jgi:KUP system potassium uptake protein
MVLARRHTKGGCLYGLHSNQLELYTAILEPGMYLFLQRALQVLIPDLLDSPLYVYSSTFSNQPTYDDLVGALSIIIWTLFLMVTVKYVCIVLSADDNGEGGTFAVYSLLARYAHIARGEPNIPDTKRLERYHTADMKAMNKAIRTTIENSRIARVVLKILAVSGVAMVMS